MKISVVIPTKNRVALLNTVIRSFDHLSSDQHEISYLVGYDINTPGMESMLNALQRDGMHVCHFGHPALPSPWTKINSVIRAHEPAEAYFLATDDVLPLTAQWDNLIAQIFERMKFKAFCWYDTNDPGNTTYPVLTHEWIETLGRAVPEYFPFWFYDTWIAQVYRMTFFDRMPIVRDIAVGGRRGKTTNMRDLKFWFKFFDATHPQREKEARALRDKFGLALDVDKLSHIINDHAQNMQELLANADKFHAHLAEDPAQLDPAPDSYAQAFATAEKWIEENTYEYAKTEQAMRTAEMS